ncbi:hypothetical protein THAOC_04782 [Thalassiosira oceanica]|uniref:Uncharacterized protein n=1 Tax=Thalassiosira oceanica TaxID=159749 RepID=K0TNJ2_THAOC|nr:hypothetical protein THAOC_04782 [Thalassiosira oceanica]|eukprot:EJK73582.1 hypothetical protein THAOC_04782 [Thalassiosira oceanica]
MSFWLLVRVLNVDRKCFGETKAELLEQVFLRGGSRVRVTLKGPSPVLLPSDGGKRDDAVRRRGGQGSCVFDSRWICRYGRVVTKVRGGWNDNVQTNIGRGQCGAVAESSSGVDWKETSKGFLSGKLGAILVCSVAYCGEDGVQEDKAKAIQFWEKAAMQGHVESRYNLGITEGMKENYDRAVRHFLISAKMGHERSVEKIKRLFVGGKATKEQYTEALKGYQDAVEGMKSHDRDEAKAWTIGGRG